MRYLVAQGVVTDAGKGESAGYALVAASASLSPQDADELQSRPETTNHLHEAPLAGHLLSFRPLPSGAWALMFRFVEGKRRGTYNRVVAYTLALPRDAVAACADDTFVALASRFGSWGTDGDASIAELLANATTAVGRLADLDLSPPVEPARKRSVLMGSRLTRLLETASPEELERDLTWIYDSLRNGERVLLGDSARNRWLMGFAWAALPAGDRMRLPWTEHLAPGAAFVYRLACAPNPEELASSGQLPDRWSVLPVEGAPALRLSGARDLVTKLLQAGKDAHEVTAELERFQVSVLDGDDLVRWVASAGWTEEVPGQSFPGAVLARTGTGGRLHPGVQAGEVVRWLAEDLRVRIGNGNHPPTEVEGSVRALREYQQLRLVAPATLGEAELPPDTLAYAVLLSLGSLSSAADGAELKRLAELLARASPGPGRANATVQLVTRLLALSPPALETVLGLEPSGSDLVAIAEALPQSGPALSAILLHLVGLARRRNETEAAVNIASRQLVPLWAGLPDDAPPNSEALDSVLELLVDSPDEFASAMAQLRGPGFATAAALLAKTAWSHAASARAIAAALARHAPDVPAHPSVRGVAAALAEAGAAVEGWIPFALAEAKLADGKDRSDDGGRWISKKSLPPATAAKVLERLATDMDRPVWGDWHLALFRAAFRAAPEPGARAAEVVERVASREGEQLARWEEVVCDVAARLGATPAGESVRASWSTALALRGALPLSDRSLQLFDELSEQGKVKVAGAWAHRTNKLMKEDQPMWSRVRNAASGNPDVAFQYELQEIASQVESGELGRLEALLTANRQSFFTESPTRAFTSACDLLLPRDDPPARKALVLRAMMDPGMWPTSTLALRDELPGALRALAPRRLAAAAFVRSWEVSVAAARELGRIWRRDFWVTVGFMLRGRGRHPALLDGFKAAATAAEEGKPFPPALRDLLEQALDEAKGRTLGSTFPRQAFRARPRIMNWRRR